MIIDNFHANYLIPRAREDPYALQKRLDKIAATLLEKEIEPFLARILPGNSCLIFIKNISLDLVFNLTQMDDRAISRLWTQTITTEIQKVIPAAASAYTSPYTGTHLAVFPNRAVYLARYIHDLVIGSAAGKWYYQEFNDLDSFSTVEIVKLICKQHQDIIEEIFLVLNEINGIDKTLEQLSGDDAKFLYSLLPGPDFEPGTQHWTGEYETVAQFISKIVKNGWLALSGVIPGSYKSCLKIYLVFLSQQKKYPGAVSKTSIKKAIRDIIFEHPEIIPDLKLQKSQQEAVKKIRTSYGGLFLLIPAIQGACPRIGKNDKTCETGEYKIRPYKGFPGERRGEPCVHPVFSDRLLEIKLFELIEQSLLPARDNISAMNALLYFMALDILRRNRAEQPYIDTADPGILIFAGLEPTASTQYLETYPEMITPAMCEEFLKNLLRSITKVFAGGPGGQFFQKAPPWPPEANETIDYEIVISVVSEWVLKLFAMRIRGFEKSSPAYISGNFLQRSSEIVLNKETIHIKLSPKPLDTVLRMSGLLEDSVKIPWLGNKKITFTLEG